MELTQLRTFQLVAAQKSFSRAAETLHLTQPAVTLQIKNLEEELGIILIERLSHSLALTPAGEVFLSYVIQLLNLADQARETVGHYARDRGRLSIGAGTTTTIFRLPRILRAYCDQYPQVEIRIRSGDSRLITELVLSNAVDIGFITTVNSHHNLTVMPLFTDEIWLMAPPGYPERLTMEKLALESLILFHSGAGFRRFLEQEFKRYLFTPKVTLELETIEAIIRFVQSGLGLAFLPEIAVQSELASGQLQKVTVEGWSTMLRRTYLIHRQDKYLTWPITAFLTAFPSEAEVSKNMHKPPVPGAE